MRTIKLILFAALYFSLSACSQVRYSDNGNVSLISSANENIILHPITGDEIDLKTVNGSIKTGKDYVLGNVRTVNGEIRLGANTQAKVVRSVNGDVQVGSGSKVQQLQTVNGDQRISGTFIAGDVSSVNGAIRLKDNCQVDGSVITNNGRVFLENSRIYRNLEMADGYIELDHATVTGDVVVRKKGFWEYVNLDHLFDFFPPKIIIGPNSVIEGRLIVNRPAKLYVHESAKIASIEGVEARYYSGSKP